jgi:hypothetical protein
MSKLAWLVGMALFLAFFGVYSYRLGIEPELWHDDYEYTYPSFSLAERGDFGSPLLGTAFNIDHRTYHFTVYYYATVHAILIRIFGAGPESIPLANTLHFALLGAVGAAFLLRRGATLGVFVFLCLLTCDERMITAARQGRPEMTAGFCLTMSVLALWLWYGEDQRRPVVLFGMSAALVAGVLSHTAVLFFAAALLLACSAPLARSVRRRDLVAAILPFAVIPLLYGYFILTDGVTNLRLQLGPQEGNVMLGRLLAHARQGEWSSLAGATLEFVRTHLWYPGIWLGVTACLAAPALAPSRLARGARFFAAVYVLFLVVHFLFLKVFVLSYRVFYQATFYMAVAFLAEATLARLAEVLKRPRWIAALRVAGVVVLLFLGVCAMGRFHERLRGRHLPYVALQGALVDALLEAGARPGDRAFVPTPFAFHLQRKFDVVSYPPNWRYFQGFWGPAFGQGLLRLWGDDVFTRVDAQYVCWAMGLAYIQPRWVLSWNGDYGVMQPFRRFFRRFPDLPGMELTEVHRTNLPPPYGGNVQVFRLELSDAISALDRTLGNAEPHCP